MTSFVEARMIDLEIDEKVDQMQISLKRLANTMFRPISRKYDEAEHDYPVELDMFRKLPILSRSKKKSGQKEAASESKPNSSQNGNRIGANMRLILSTEALCWGDAALLLSLPNAGLGNAALLAWETMNKSPALVTNGLPWPSPNPSADRIPDRFQPPPSWKTINGC
jgi:acyl-CoA dehydrogenase